MQSIISGVEQSIVAHRASRELFLCRRSQRVPINQRGRKRLTGAAEDNCGSREGYGSFRIGVDRKHALKWLAAASRLSPPQKVFAYSETAMR
jgi:hypothetical protein